mgnify:CR=1 FL=1
MLQMIKLGLSELQRSVPTVLRVAPEEDHALGQALLAHTRDPGGGLRRFQLRERAQWRQVKAVLRRASEAEGGV